MTERLAPERNRLYLSVMAFMVLSLLVFGTNTGCDQTRCSHDSQCDGGKKICIGGECQSCELYGCNKGKTCVEGECRPSGCQTDSDCQRGEICDNQICIVPDGGLPELPAPPPRSPQRCPKQAQLCQADAECLGETCTSPLFLRQQICTQRCQGDGDCCGGFKCHADPVNERGYCVPGCKSAADCQTTYPHLPRCTTDGHCWSFGTAGDSCVANTDCATGLICESPGGIGFRICTKPCKQSAECGRGHICDEPIRGVLICLPQCKTVEDCAGYPVLNSCHNHGHCWRDNK